MATYITGYYVFIAHFIIGVKLLNHLNYFVQNEQHLSYYKIFNLRMYFCDDL